MGCSQNGHGPVNQFALVSYIPGLLGEFLDLLRLQLAPDCRPHAHVTVLPPRPLNGPVEHAESELRQVTSRFHAFEVKLGAVEIFESSQVIYIEVDRGERELRAMHHSSIVAQYSSMSLIVFIRTSRSRKIFLRSTFRKY